MRLAVLALLVGALSPAWAFAQVQHIATPTTLRQVAAQVLAAGVEADVTCAPGDYPAFLRSGAAYVGFRAKTTFRCAEGTFTGGTIAGAENLTWIGGTFTGRVIVSGFRNVAFVDLEFPAGHGVMARSGTGLLVEGLTIQRSGAAINLIDVTDARITDNVVTDFSGNAGISAYGGGNVTITYNVVTGSRLAKKGVHPDGIQTADSMKGTVDISFNTVVLPGQGIFGGGTPDLFIAKQNYIQVDFPNALTFKSRQPAQVAGNTVRKWPSARTDVPRMINYGIREGLAAADGGINDVMGRAVTAK